jgi:type II secretion system (T2SS) protein M
MTLQPRDRRALQILAGVLPLALLYWLVTRTPATSTIVAAPVESLDRSERKLLNLRTALATVGGKEAQLKQASAELSDREKGLIPGDTANQAQAQLVQIMRRVAKEQAPPIDIRQVELGQPRAYGDAYGLVTVSVSMDCRPDEIVNLLATLTQQPEMIATDEIRFGTANPKSKNMLTRMTISGVVPRKLLPEKKGLGAF